MYSSPIYTCICIIFFCWEADNGQEKEEKKVHTRDPKTNVSFFKLVLHLGTGTTKPSMANWICSGGIRFHTCHEKLGIERLVDVPYPPPSAGETAP